MTPKLDSQSFMPTETTAVKIIFQNIGAVGLEDKTTPLVLLASTAREQFLTGLRQSVTTLQAISQFIFKEAGEAGEAGNPVNSWAVQLGLPREYGEKLISKMVQIYDGLGSEEKEHYEIMLDFINTPGLVDLQQETIFGLATAMMVLGGGEFANWKLRLSLRAEELLTQLGINNKVIDSWKADWEKIPKLYRPEEKEDIEESRILLTPALEKK